MMPAAGDAARHRARRKTRASFSRIAAGIHAPRYSVSTTSKPDRLDVASTPLKERTLTETVFLPPPHAPPHVMGRTHRLAGLTPEGSKKVALR
jgi:hypothetical protein